MIRPLPPCGVDFGVASKGPRVVLWVFGVALPSPLWCGIMGCLRLPLPPTVVWIFWGLRPRDLGLYYGVFGVAPPPPVVWIWGLRPRDLGLYYVVFR